MNQNGSESLDVKKGVHVFMSSPFALHPVSVGVFPRFDDVHQLRCSPVDFHEVTEWIKSYLASRFSGNVYFVDTLIESESVYLAVFEVSPFNGQSDFDFSVRVFAA